MGYTRRYQLLGNVIFQTITDETVIINLENGSYYSLNPTGSVIWEELMKQANVNEIAQLYVAPENPEPTVVPVAIAEFVQELLAQDLLTPADAAATRTPSDTPPNRLAFTTPKLEQFTDMEELIPLDPIHQVGTLGWPHRKVDEQETSGTE